MASLVIVDFSRFGFIMRTDRHTDADERLTRRRE